MEPAPKKRKLSTIPAASSSLDLGSSNPLQNCDMSLPTNINSNLVSEPAVVPSISNGPESKHSAERRVSAEGERFIPLNKYIPAGCLLVQRHVCEITTQVWQSCDTWKWLTGTNISHTFPAETLSDTLQTRLLSASGVGIYYPLLWAGWIRLEFKMKNMEWGQFRVYILPDDVGRSMITRSDISLRKLLQKLLSVIDMSSAIWNEDIPPEKSMDKQDAFGLSPDSKLGGQDPSLFYLFNTLPSPLPEPMVVKDQEAAYAMQNILEGTVDGLKTIMLPYQRRSAAMMLQREAQPAQFIDPRLRRPLDQAKNPWYFDPLSGAVLREPRMYEASRGGICAETMGLGKTLICLSLILSTKELSSQIPVEYSVGTLPVRKKVGSLVEMAAATIGRTGMPWKSVFERSDRGGSHYRRCIEAIRKSPGHYFVPSAPPRRASRRPASMPPRKIYLSTTTLVVVPANLVRQWESEIAKHTIGLKVLVMAKRTKLLPPAQELLEYDIILFSRQRFDIEARDRTDSQGKPNQYVSDTCVCNTIVEGCSCRDRPYHSPLRDIHFKRLITDEGHTMGNASTSSKTNAVIVVDFLQLSARWIVSGTPTQGLYGADIALALEGNSESRSYSDHSPPHTPGESLPNGSFAPPNVDMVEERKDLEKLGNIATVYLKSRPWANTFDGDDKASWSQYVMQPRHGVSSHGNMACLRDTLEGMIIRHRPEDVLKDLELPPLHQKVVLLEGSYQDKLSINLFSLMITSNAVTSERKDADYLFHPRQRKALGDLVSNLRQASFFWSGFTKEDVLVTIQIAETFLEKSTVVTSEEDKMLLRNVVQLGSAAISNQTWIAASEHHEMPMYLDTGLPKEVCEAWALDGNCFNPSLLGATQLLAMQKLVKRKKSSRPLMMQDLLEDGRLAMESAKASLIRIPRPASKLAKIQRKLDDSAPTLAGGLKVGGEPSSKKKQVNQSLPGRKVSKARQPLLEIAEIGNTISVTVPATPLINSGKSSGLSPAPQIKPELPSVTPVLKPKSVIDGDVQESLRLATIVSTASAKLSYLITQVLRYHSVEKIIIFYEADNVAYYIAQALEVVSVEHLIYAKALSSDRRSQYLTTFNQSPQFRVLLMDVSQAAFGLDISSASRVYFVNPVINKQVEAQAVKRAHRIGQFRPVYVETLVLRETIEEMILERRKEMSNDEQKKCKSVLDDQTMYDWIKNVRFVPLPVGDVPGPYQMAPLGEPQIAFSRIEEAVSSHANDPDAGLVAQDFSPQSSKKSKGKRKVSMSINGDDFQDTRDNILLESKKIRPKKKVNFLIEDPDDSHS